MYLKSVSTELEGRDRQPARILERVTAGTTNSLLGANWTLSRRTVWHLELAKLVRRFLRPPSHPLLCDSVLHGALDGSLMGGFSCALC